ncbi:hypothetical protein [Streptomyces sp. NPDC053427]|uniref:hypothetical protein n=1 Tax=Streptomyces sp. NPDC053427 TaxID=3365701 RepID=UPI0037D53EB9
MGYLSADPAEIRAALEDQYSGTHLTTGIGEHVLPPLLAPLAQPEDDELFLDVPAVFPAPGVPVSIDSHDYLEHGWTDL